MDSKTPKVKCFVLDGVEYVNVSAATEMTGHSVPSFKKRVEVYGIKPAHVPTYKRTLYRKQDIVDGIEKGYFTKWYNK